MPRKPWTIVTISFIYLLSPFVIIFSNAWINMVPLIGPSGILHRLQLTDWLILTIYIINASAVFTVRKPGWWIFLCASLVLIGYNVWGYVHNPLHPFPALLVYNTLLFIGAALLFRKEIIAPYFNPRLRWWESDSRYSLDFFCILHLDQDEKAAIRDISLGGCFVAFHGDLPMDADIPLELKLQNMTLHLSGRAIRKAQHPFSGWGIKFTELMETEKDGLQFMLHKLEQLSEIPESSDERRAHSRLQLSQWVYWLNDAEQQSARLVDISRSGCCLEHEKPGFNGHTNYTLHFSDFDAQLVLHSEKIWERRDNGQILTGFHFTIEEKEDKHRLNRFISYCKKAGSHERNEGKEMDQKLLQDSLQLTPVAKLYRRKKED